MRAELKNFLRAGVLKKISLTVTRVPILPAVGCISLQLPSPSALNFHADDSPSDLLVISNRETELILAKASPRNPKVATDAKSAPVLILLVACRLTASNNSSLGIPKPLSVTEIDFSPPSSISISIWSAPESKAFSSNSLTTEAGLSTTSPAAIWSAK